MHIYVALLSDLGVRVIYFTIDHQRRVRVNIVGFNEEGADNLFASDVATFASGANSKHRIFLKERMRSQNWLKSVVALVRLSLRGDCVNDVAVVGG